MRQAQHVRLQRNSQAPCAHADTAALHVRAHQSCLPAVKLKGRCHLCFSSRSACCAAADKPCACTVYHQNVRLSVPSVMQQSHYIISAGFSHCDMPVTVL